MNASSPSIADWISAITAEGIEGSIHDEQIVAIETSIKLNDDDQTVTITYKNVNINDVDDLLAQQGTLEGRAEMTEHLITLLSGAIIKRLDSMPESSFSGLIRSIAESVTAVV